MDLNGYRSWELKRGIIWLASRLSAFTLWVSAVAILVIVVLNAINIVLRYVFLTSLSWGEEAMQYIMVFGIYTGAVGVAWQQAHIRIDTLLKMAPHHWRRSLNIASTIIATAILIPVVLASYRVVTQLAQLDEYSDALHIPIWIPQSVIPISLLLIVVMSLLRIFAHESLDGNVSGDEPSQL